MCRPEIIKGLRYGNISDQAPFTFNPLQADFYMKGYKNYIMLKNTYTRTTDELEETLSRINLFSIISDLGEISLKLGHIGQNFDEYVMFVEDPEEAELIQERLNNLDYDFQTLKNSVEDKSLELFSLMNCLHSLISLEGETQKEPETTGNEK